MYPHLIKILVNMFMDNIPGFMYSDCIKPESDWQWPENAAELETMAAKLTDEEKETMAAGELGECQDVISKYQCRELNDFLAEVFDGDLWGNFHHDDLDN